MEPEGKKLVVHGAPTGPVPRGRPKGSGKSALFREWALGTGIQRLFDIAEGKGHGYKIHGQKILEVGPTVAVQLEALRLALAYGLGRPIIPFVLDDRANNPEEAKKRADEVWSMIRELENDAISGAEGRGDEAGVADRAA